ncbi:hypothetical protein FIBSPDRAFT_930304 [Athelia psychrophila]|uniref:PX domain-containing protein n=1 Tax=Athelia psychrophila TaxID=1759441 RepID=A0A166MAR6_9AGAM|nr:hypothetical protein FIBSPDRAFT_930304 [Fibularhizoctonia sp. CBS 109695]
MSAMSSPYAQGTGGADGAPMDPDAWKRAVYRAPPTHFSVEILQPSKEGGSIGFGLRISPIREDGRSQSSHGSNSEYDIWRRWEDCLCFQDCLEQEYEQKSRLKVKRLQAGKGVKKHGVYARKDAASSWDSLPPGPDPKSVAVDIHQHIPKLTKKGTLFRASQATIDQRHIELQACINGLFAEDVPTLIQDMRENRKVTDFFGYWRMDFDLAVKRQKRAAKAPEQSSRASMSSSVFATYFSGGSNTNFADPDATLVNPAAPNKKAKSKASPALSFTSPRKASHVPSSPLSSRSGKTFNHSGSEDEKSLSRRGSDASTSSSVGPPTPLGSNGATPYIVRHDPPVSFGYNPDQPPYGGASGLEPLPEDDELVATMAGVKVRPNLRPQGRDRRASNRNASMYGSPDGQEEVSAEEKSNNRQSWMTTTSIAETINPASYLDELGLSEFSLPKSPSSSAFPRMSVASFATFMTDNSADAITMTPGGNLRRSASADSRRTTRPDVEEEEGAWSDGEGDLLDAYFNDAFGRPSSVVFDQGPATPTASHPTSVSFRASMFSTRSRNSMVSSTSSTPSSSSSGAGSSTSSASPSASVFTASTTTSSFGGISTLSPDGHISVKVSHNMAIISLRVSRSIPFADLRVKIYDKFVTQENVPLSRSFAVGYVPPSSGPVGSGVRARSASLASAEIPKGAQMRFIHSQNDWESAVATMDTGKLSLRAIGEEAS